MRQFVPSLLHPLDHIATLLHHRIPVVLVAGDSDKTVPYVENGALVAHAYETENVPIRVFLKAGCDHHPHGLKNPSTVADAFEAFSSMRKES